MLVLTRRQGEEIVIGGNIHVTVVSVQGNRVRLGITAPREVAVERLELVGKTEQPPLPITTAHDSVRESHLAVVEPS